MLRIILIAVIIFLLSSAIATWQILRPKKIEPSFSPSMFSMEAKEETIITDDNLKLSSWYFPSNKDSAIIFLHGYPAQKSDLLPLASKFYPDFSLLLLDMRYFGKSEGKITTLGIKEKEDLKAAVSWLSDKGYKNIGVFGFSLGGAVSLMGASEDKRIKAVASYGAFSDLKTLGRDLYYPLIGIDWIMVELISFWGRFFIGGSPDEISPVKNMAKIEIPVLIIHNREDEQVPFNHAKRIKAALSDNPSAEFLFIDGFHGEFSCSNKLKDFFKKHLHEN